MAGTTSHRSWTRSLNRVQVVRFIINDINYATDDDLEKSYIWTSPMILTGAGTWKYEVTSAVTAGNGDWHVEFLVDPDDPTEDASWIDEARYWDQSTTWTDTGGTPLSRFRLTTGLQSGIILPGFGHQSAVYTQSGIVNGVPIFGGRIRFTGTTSVGIADFRVNLMFKG